MTPSGGLNLQTTVIAIPTGEITGWESFHSVFRAALGFPDFYGCNMNAWIDCMTYLDDGMTNVSIEEDGLLALRIDDAPDFRRRCPEQYDALIECTAFVNSRSIARGGKPMLALMLSGQLSKSA